MLDAVGHHEFYVVKRLESTAVLPSWLRSDLPPPCRLNSILMTSENAYRAGLSWSGRPAARI
jgi:hypothetical protein